MAKPKKTVKQRTVVKDPEEPRARARSGLDANKPWISNYPPLRLWLDKHDARCQWQLPYGDSGMQEFGEKVPAAYVELWFFRTGSMAILVVHCNQHGWEIYTPCSDTKISVSLEDAERRLGLVDERLREFTLRICANCGGGGAVAGVTCQPCGGIGARAARRTP